MAAILAAVLGLIPLAIAPRLLFYFDVTPKVAILFAGTALAVGLWAWRGSYNCPAVPAAPGRWFAWLMAAQALSLLISTVWSSHPALSFGGTNWRRFGSTEQFAVLLFALLLASWLSSGAGRLQVLLRVAAVSGTLAGLYGIAQYFGWDPWIAPIGYHAGQGTWSIVRPPSTLGHAVYFANYELFGVFFGAALAASERGKRWRWIGLCAVVTGSISIVLSGTRGALLGLAAGAVYLAFRMRMRLFRRAAAPAMAILAVIAVLFFTPSGSLLRGRVQWTLLEQPLGGARTLLWHDSLTMSGRHWLRGHGVETFSSEFPQFQSVALARAYPDFYHESPHNFLLDTLTAQGILGLAALLGIIVLGFVRSRQDAYLGAALAAAVVSHMFAVLIVPTAIYFYATVAALVAAPAAEVRPRPWWARAAAAVCAASMAVLAVPFMVSDAALAAVSRGLDDGRLEQAVHSYSVSERWRVPGGTPDLWYSRKLAQFIQKTRSPIERIQAWPRAMEAAIKATQSSEDPQNAWYSLAAFYAAQNDADHTEAALRSSIACAPRWFKPHWLLAQVLRGSGKLNEALREAELAAALGGEREPEVTRTVDQIKTLLTVH
ncbi:MAG: O-antigen ligase family protein [Acidobacteriales bacterium]|nr:O-antigen ligase family protein [Terriglobales bacterium]